MGAEILEYHITFDKRSFGPDSVASLAIDEARHAAKVVKKIPLALGSAEEKNDVGDSVRNLFGYSLTAKDDISKGELITIEKLETTKPSGHGISPLDYQNIIGKKAIVEMKKGCFITEDMII